ncbi:MAG TPA: hypothetical protein VFZ10_07680, partial [Geminicoccaceae bacterium]
MCHDLLQVVNPLPNATAVDAEIPPAEASAAVEDKAGAIGSERHDLGAHQIGESENGGSLDVEAAPVVLVLCSQHRARRRAANSIQARQSSAAPTWKTGLTASARPDPPR